ncbi:MAG: AbrB/MazE/SpoVT family DNA-binding domain-containing protein [Anaerolineae bacterium]
MNAIRTQLVKIGNSRGVRMPKPLIDQAGLGTEVEISVEDNQLVIRPASHPRQDWEEQNARDLAILNKQADRLNQEAADVLAYQVIP